MQLIVRTLRLLEALSLEATAGSVFNFFTYAGKWLLGNGVTDGGSQAADQALDDGRTSASDGSKRRLLSVEPSSWLVIRGGWRMHFSGGHPLFTQRVCLP
jgi:hypothetical protein